jgi:hypothetical protein
VILQPKARMLVVIVAIAWMVPSAINASKIEPTSRAEQFLPDDHPFQAIINVLGNEFPKSDEEPNMEVYVNWGVDMVDRDGVNQLLDAGFVGKGRLDDKFVFNEAMQEHVLQACVAVGSGIDHKTAEYHEMVGFRSDTGFGQVDCWVYDLSVFVKIGKVAVENNASVGTPFGQASYAWPIPEAQLADVMEEFMQSTVAGTLAQTVEEKYEWAIGWDRTQRKVRFISVSMASCCIHQHMYLTREVGMVEYNKFEAYVTEMNKRGKAAGVTVDCFQTDYSEDDVRVPLFNVFFSHTISPSSPLHPLPHVHLFSPLLFCHLLTFL